MIKDIASINNVPTLVTDNRVGAAKGPAFGEVLTRAIEELNASQVKADKAVQGFLSGEVKDVHQVMIALEEAHLMMQLSLEVRNKLVEAYQELSRMPV
ncbi:flagellar hook-basal body complex protein FliE [Desulforudis sp. 1088]|uniref:flagellar hook-basal body complex protein FliE n=1 Tax=unclassified Candidatus Desulforudis TaxID=2635950 RepID=UPI00347A3C9D